jgi:hypothetical protein
VTVRARLIVGLLLGMLVVATAIGGTLLIGGADDAPSPAATTAVPLKYRFENEAGGYSFGYPKGWEVRADGTATTLTNPDGDVIVTFGLGPAGRLPVAAQRLADALSAAYTDIEDLGTQEQTVAGQPALMVGGVGTNEHGVRVRFLAITVATPEGNRSISVFTPEGSSPSEVLPPVQRVVASFRP